MPGSRLLRVFCLGLLATAAAVAAAGAEPRETAIPSERAFESLLLGVARAGERLVAVGEWGHVLLSDDGGESWRQAREVAARATLTAVGFAGVGHGWAVGHDQVILHSADGGESWRLQHAEPELESPLLSLLALDARHVIAVGAFGRVLETRDGGESWAPRPPPGGDEDDAHLNQLFAGPQGTLFVVGERGSVHRSRDEGASWQRVAPEYEGSFWGGLTLPDGGVLVFGMRGHVFRSDDLGASWSEVESHTDKSLSGGTLIGDRVVLVGLGGVVLTSRDGARTFEGSIRPGRRALTAVAGGSGGRVLLFGETGIDALSGDAGERSPPAVGRGG